MPVGGMADGVRPGSSPGIGRGGMEGIAAAPAASGSSAEFRRGTIARIASFPVGAGSPPGRTSPQKVCEGLVPAPQTRASPAGIRSSSSALTGHAGVGCRFPEADGSPACRGGGIVRKSCHRRGSCAPCGSTVIAFPGGGTGPAALKRERGTPRTLNGFFDFQLPPRCAGW